MGREAKKTDPAEELRAKAERLVARAYAKTGLKLSSGRTIELTERLRSYKQSEPWRSFNDARREVLNGAHLVTNDPQRKVYSNFLARLIPKEEKIVAPLTEREIQLAQGYFSWYYKEGLSFPSDKQGDEHTNKNVGDNVDIYLLERPAIAHVVDVPRLQNLVRRYQGEKSGKTQVEKNTRLRAETAKKAPLLAGGKLLKKVSPDQKAEVRARKETRQIASRLEKEKTAKAQEEFKVNQGALGI